MERGWTLSCVFLCALWTASRAQMTFSPQAEILSADGRSPLDFAVGSNVTLRCRQTHGYDVSTMSLHRRSTNQTLNVTVVGNSSIETTLLDVTACQNDVISCRAASGRILADKGLCIGYAPTEDFNVSCKLYPGDSLECCVLTDQRQDSLCSVHWTMYYRRPQWEADEWEAFPYGGLVDDATLCASLSATRLFYHGVSLVRAVATNQMGNASAVLQFVPARHTEPLPVEQLSLNTNSTQPGTILVTWRHNQDLDDVMCKAMGLFYDVIVTPNYDFNTAAMPHSKADCRSSVFREIQQYRVTGLLPFTAYNVTVISRSLLLSGPARSGEKRTPQSRPLKAPSIVGWSCSTGTPGLVAVFWKRYLHRDRGGPIVAYSTKVTDSVTSETVNDSTSVEGQELVTFPRVLQGCLGGCVVMLTASTVVGSSPPATVTISNPLSQRVPVVHIETNGDNATRTVSWEGSANVTSVVWCFGAPFTADISLIHCKTELGEKAVELSDTRHVTIGEDSLAAEDGESTTLCTGCDWHFALRLSSAGTDTGRLVWGRHPHPGHGDLKNGTYYAVVSVVLALTLASALCALSLMWCGRRWKKKAQKFSALDFSHKFGSEKNIGWKKCSTPTSFNASNKTLQETPFTAAPDKGSVTSKDSVYGTYSDRTWETTSDHSVHHVIAASSLCPPSVSEVRMKEGQTSPENVAETDRLLAPEDVLGRLPGLSGAGCAASRVTGGTASGASDGELPSWDQDQDQTSLLPNEQILADFPAFDSGHGEVCVEKPERQAGRKLPLTSQLSNGYVQTAFCPAVAGVVVQSQQPRAAREVDRLDYIVTYPFSAVGDDRSGDSEGENAEPKCSGEKVAVCVRHSGDNEGEDAEPKCSGEKVAVCVRHSGDSEGEDSEPKCSGQKVAVCVTETRTVLTDTSAGGDCLPNLPQGKRERAAVWSPSADRKSAVLCGYVQVFDGFVQASDGYVQVSDSSIYVQIHEAITGGNSLD